MPLNIQKKQEIARQEIESQLFALGLSPNEVAQAMDIDDGSAVNDFKRIGGRQVSPSDEASLKEHRDKTFVAALREYAKLFVESKKTDDGLMNALARYLNLPLLHATAAAIVAILQALYWSTSKKSLRGYRRLLWAIFGETRAAVASSGLTGAELFKAYLWAVCANEAEVFPRESLAQAISEWAANNFPQYALVVTDRIAEQLDKALKTLTPNEEKTLQMRFGFAGECQHYLEEIGQTLALTRERIRQIEAKALRKLRHPSRSEAFKVFPMTSAELADAWLDKPLQPVDLFAFHAVVPPAVPTEYLSRSVDELELSVRSYNVLRNNGISTVRKLVQKTEGELLRMSFFGRKSLNEIKEILAAMGLSLGMKFDGKGNLVNASVLRITESQ